MSRALALLVFYKARGRLRRLVRSWARPAGLLSLVVGAPIVLTFYAWALLFFWQIGSLMKPGPIREWGPLALAVVFALQLVASAMVPGLRFEPTEINRLFAAPATRRQLAGYRFVEGTIPYLPMWALVCAALVPATGSKVAGVAAIVLFVLFRAFAGRAVGFATLELARRYGARGTLPAVGVVVAVVGALFARMILIVRDGPFDALLDDFVVGVAVAPFRPFVGCFLADGAMPALAAVGLTALAMAAAFARVPDLRAWAIRAAAARRRTQERKRRDESGGRAWTLLSPPMLPHWGGAGPLIWRQLVALAGTPSLAFYVAAVAAAAIAPEHLIADRDVGRGLSIGLLGTFTVVSILVLPGMARFDFRADLKRMALLRRLPVASWRLAAAQVVVPIAVVCAVGALIWLLWMWKAPQAWEEASWAALLAVPFVALLVMTENLMVLLAPAAFASAGVGAQALGQRLLLRGGQVVVLGVVGALCAVVWTAVSEITGGAQELSLIAAAMILSAAAAAMVPALAWAFRRFDVAEDRT